MTRSEREEGSPGTAAANALSLRFLRRRVHWEAAAVGAIGSLTAGALAYHEWSADGDATHAWMILAIGGSLTLAAVLLAMRLIRHVRIEQRLTDDLALANGELQRRMAEMERMQSDLRRNETRLKVLVKGAPLFLVAADRDGLVVSCEGRDLPELGLIPGRSVGRPLAALLGEGVGAEAVGRVLAGAEEEFVLEREKAAYQVRLGPVFDDSGEVNGLVALIQDVTSQRNTERSLERTLAEQATILENTMAGIVLLTRGEIRWANEMFCRLLGHDRSELIGQPAAGLRVDPKALTPLREASRAALQSGQGFTFEEWFQRRDGAPVCLRGSGKAVDPDDLARGTIWVVEDVTGRRAGEEQRNLSAAVFENSSDGIAIADTENRLVAVNRAFAAITGYLPEEVIGRNFDLINADRHGLSLFRRMWEAIEKRGHWEGELWSLRKDGTVFPEWRSVRAITDERGTVTHYVSTFQDITRRKQDEERIRFQAYYDPLTGLPNRLLLQDRLREALANAARHERQVALMYIDLDSFKVINDSLGHATGDNVLLSVAKRIKACLPDNAVLSRPGGDEFLLLLPAATVEKAAELANRIQDGISRPLDLERMGHEVVMTASIGIAVAPRDGTTVGDVIRSADTAASHAKRAGRNCHQFFTEEMNVVAQERLVLENKLRRAIHEGELLLYYQPKVDLRSGRITGAEALVRWDTPSGIISPDKFIPVAEETGLIVALGFWVLRAACMEARGWPRDTGPGVHVAVNISPRQLRQDDFERQVLDVLDETGLPPAALELEITESLLMEHSDAIMEVLESLRGRGIKVTVDDFGTGYSSLSYLGSLPIDAMKIDRSFIGDIGPGQNGAFLVGAVVAIGQSLGLRVTAEGVETLEQLEFLRQQWCDEMQGYYFSRPVPAEDFARMLREGRRL